MGTLEEIGNLAYQKAMWNDYKGAISLLDKAIIRYPRDARLINNRSYCYCKIKDYKRALMDAEFMIKEFPTFLKSYFRKADVYIETKRYKEAEAVFAELIKLDPSCHDAKVHLREVQIMAICENNKYWVTEAIQALELTNYNTDQAKQFLDIGGLKNARQYDKSEIYYSDDEDDEPSSAGAVGGSSKPTTSTPAAATVALVDDDEYDPYTDPSNPFKCNSVWVGNVTKKISEEKLRPLFTKYGKIKSIIVQHQNFCAFVNYYEHHMAAKAMRNFQQQMPMEDTYLVIRYPDNAGAKTLTFSKRGGKK